MTSQLPSNHPPFPIASPESLQSGNHDFNQASPTRAPNDPSADEVWSPFKNPTVAVSNDGESVDISYRWFDRVIALSSVWAALFNYETPWYAPWNKTLDRYFSIYKEKTGKRFTCLVMCPQMIVHNLPIGTGKEQDPFRDFSDETGSLLGRHSAVPADKPKDLDAIQTTLISKLEELSDKEDEKVGGSLTDAMQNLHIKGQKKNSKASNKALKKAHRVMPDFVGIVMEGIVGESGVDSEPESYVVRAEDMIMSIELKPPIASRKTRTSIFQRVHDGQTATQAEYIHSRKKQAGDRVPVIVGLGVYWQYNEDDSTGKPFPTISIGPARPIPEAIAGIPEVLVVPSDPNDSPTQSKERSTVSQGRQATGADIPKAKTPGHSGDPPRGSPEKKDTADVKRRKLMEKLQMAVNNFSEEDVACEIDRIVAMHYDIGIRLGTVISCYAFMLITKRIQHLYPKYWLDLRQQTDGKLVPGKSLDQAIMEKNIFYREAMASSRELQTQQAEEIAFIRKELAEREKRIEALNAELQAYIDATTGSSDRGVPVKEPKSGKAKKGGK